MRVLEIATGSGEMFRRLIRANRSGATVGLDLSPNMAHGRTLNHTLRREKVTHS
jgi:ubiquinone/menaquinone biosynthesis C-methylase UbiE